MIETILGLILFVLIISVCCCSDSNSSSNNTPPKRNTNVPSRENTYYNHDTYSECPSCGAPFFDGYCGECGYPDVNQGWLGEEYG